MRWTVSSGYGCLSCGQAGAPAGLVDTIKDNQQNLTSYEYDLRGNRTAVVDALTNRTEFQYDLGDRLTKIIYPDTTFVTFAYDSRGEPDEDQDSDERSRQ